MRLTKVGISLIVLATLLYPLVVYYGIQRLGVSTLAATLFILMLLRAVLSQTIKQVEQVVLLSLLGLLCVLAAWFKSENLLRYYPVLMNLGVSALFFTSLLGSQPLILKMVSRFKKDISDSAKRYMRGLTFAWGVLLMVNSGVSFYTACCLSISQWALYNGAIAYLVFGVFTLLELAYRQHYKAKHTE